MRLFSRLGVRSKVVGGFGLMILFILSVGVVGYVNSNTMKGNLDVILDRYLPGLNYLLQADRDMQQLLVAERSLLQSSPGEEIFKELLDDYEQNLTQARERFEKYKGLAASPEEKAIIAKNEADWAKWMEASRSVITACREGTDESMAKAREISFGQAAVLFEAARGGLDKLTEEVERLAEEARALSLKEYRQSLTIGFGLAGLAVLVALGLVIGLVSTVVRPVALIQGAAKDVAEGDFDRRIKILRDDDMGRMSMRLNKAFEKVAEKAYWYEAILDAIPWPISVTDLDMNWTFFNKATEGVTGAKREDVIGKQCSNWGADICGTERCGIAGLRRGETTSYFNQPGMDRDFQVDTSYITDRDGEKIGHIEVIQDITEANQMKEEAEEALKNGVLMAAKKLEGVVESITSSSEELAAQVEESTRGADIQRDRAAETATAMEEMNSTVLEVAKNAGHAAENADTTKVKAENGAEVVGRVVKAITDISDRVTEMKRGLDDLGQRADGIGAIMNVITDIADQTNLLALNAAIEAARAGEAGRGFAVVADEVRKLAEKTMNATKEVGSVVSDIQTGARGNIEHMDKVVDVVGRGTELAEESGRSLQEIVTLADGTSDQVRAIAAASEEQSTTTDEIARNMDEINRISAETSETMIQSSQAINELARLAVDLQSLIREMKEG